MSQITPAGREEHAGIGQVLHCACLLLGYKSSSYGVESAPDMFDKANPKGMEAMLHYLLNKIRGAAQAKKAWYLLNLSLCLGLPLSCSI